MVDTVSKRKRSQIMSKVRSKNTSPEKKLRLLLKKLGLKPREQYGKYKIDFAFPKVKLAIFVDGCFWHLCKKHSRIPESNKRYWALKLKKNKARDSLVNAKLKSEGWKILRIWEHELKKERQKNIIYKIIKLI